MKRSFIASCVLFASIAGVAFAAGSAESGAAAAPAGPIVVRHMIRDRPESAIREDMPIIAELSKKMGVTFKWEPAPSERNQGLEKFNIMLASGDIPDLVSWDELAPVTKAALQGVFEPLNQLVDANSPNFKKLIVETPKIRRDITLPDGNYYVYPFIGAVRPAEIFFLRQDWLDKLGLKKPTTTDEWYTVLKAFKEKDPNGNGKQDEIPFVVRSKTRGVLAFAMAFGLDGWMQEFMIDGDTVIYPYIDARMKNALTFIRKLYDEKLIDNEYITTDANIWVSKLSTETAGATFDWWVRIDFFQNALKAKNPNVRFTWAYPPKMADGKAFTMNQQNLVRGGTAIAKKSKYKNELAKILDYSYGTEGNVLRNFGLEGTHYTMVNGVPTFNEATMKFQGGPLFALFSAGLREFAYKKDIRFEEQLTSSKDSAESFKAYDPIIKPALPELAFTPEEQKAISSTYADIQTYKNEMIDKFIMGIEPLDKFDAFAAKVKSMGIDQVLQNYNTAYKRYLAIK